ncbi:hypothetical protein HDV00_008718 [Rhizophlyctis rosea]|nr:hypothetical protein HDV00_008718 [Rhizophlyctis rosea]
MFSLSSSWIKDTSPRDRLVILRALIKGSADHSIKVFILRTIVSQLRFRPNHWLSIFGGLLLALLNAWSARTQLCHAFNGESSWVCAGAGGDPYQQSAPLPDSTVSNEDLKSRIRDFYASWTTIRFISTIEGILIFSFLLLAIVGCIILAVLDSRRRRSPKSSSSPSSDLPYTHPIILKWSTRWAWVVAFSLHFSLLYGLAGIKLLQADIGPQGKRIIRKHPRLCGPAPSQWKFILGSAIYALLCLAGTVVGIGALWGKLELAQVGVTLPEHLIVDPQNGGRLVPWSIWQIALLLGLANNIAALYSIAAPSKITYLTEHHIDPELFAASLVEEHGFLWAALIWFGTDKRDLAIGYEEVLLQLVPEPVLHDEPGVYE